MQNKTNIPNSLAHVVYLKFRKRYSRNPPHHPWLYAPAVKGSIADQERVFIRAADINLQEFCCECGFSIGDSNIPPSTTRSLTFVHMSLGLHFSLFLQFFDDTRKVRFLVLRVDANANSCQF